MRDPVLLSQTCVRRHPVSLLARVGAGIAACILLGIVGRASWTTIPVSPPWMGRGGDVAQRR